MVQMDFLAANHVHIVGLCGQNWNRTLGYSFALRSLRPRNVVKYLTTVEWTTRPQCMSDGRGLPWALASGHSQWTVHSLPYRLRHRCPTARTAASPIPEGMMIFCLVVLCIVAKRYVLANNCLKERIGNQGQSWFFGSPPYFYFRFRLYGHRDGRFCLIRCFNGNFEG